MSETSCRSARENEIPAPVEGSVKEIRVKVGDNVSTDDVMMVIA
ncbi:MAG: hypothetical protein JRI41_09120 [Deltaproteobacteria bacterium]|nr:hypothetical protein [Deltaproteobacteria bacterium]